MSQPTSQSHAMHAENNGVFSKKYKFMITNHEFLWVGRRR